MASRDVWVVDYFQEDCAPCMQIKTFMEQLAKDVHRTSSTNTHVCALRVCVCIPSLTTNPIHPSFHPSTAAYGVKVGVFDTKQSKQAQKLAIAAGLVKLPALKVRRSVGWVGLGWVG